MKNRFMRERGQGTIEYALIIVIIALAVIAILALVHDASPQTAIPRFLTISAPLAVDPSPGNTPTPSTDRVVYLIAVAVPVAVVMLMVYLFMHTAGSDHTPGEKTKREE